MTYFQGPLRASPRIGSAAAARAARQRFCAACQCEHRPCGRLTGKFITALPKFIGPPPKFIVWAVEIIVCEEFHRFRVMNFIAPG